MKKLVGIVIGIIGISLVGCMPKNNQMKGNSAMKYKFNLENSILDENISYSFSAEDFFPFIKAYFSFSDDELLKLNQISSQIDSYYWEHLRKDYGPILKEKIGIYLSPEVNVALENYYLQESFSLPKWVKLNEYAVSGHAEVQKIEIQGARELEDEVIYEMTIETINDCYPLEAFYKQYEWNEKRGYWIKRSEEQKEEDTADFSDTTYIYAQEPIDQMRLKQQLSVRVKNQKELKVTALMPMTLWGTDAEDKKSFIGTQYMSRVPYKSQVSNMEYQVIEKVMDQLIRLSRDELVYYNKAFESGRASFETMWKDKGLENEIALDGSYRLAFPKSIIPIRDEIIELKRIDSIVCTPSVYSTREQPRYIVDFPVEALLNNDQIVYYRYKYFVCLEKNKVEAIQFQSRVELSEEEISIGGKE